MEYGERLDAAIAAAKADHAAVDQAQFRDGDWGKFHKKYLRPEIIFPRKAAEIALLGLHLLPPLRLLDLGAGTGHFCLIAGKLGHDALALTDPEPPIFLRFARAAGVPTVAQRLHPRRPLDAPGRFDLITASRITFAARWSREDWQCFLDNLQAMLTPGGALFFAFNYSGPDGEKDLDSLDDAELGRRELAREMLIGAGLRELRYGMFVSSGWTVHPEWAPAAA